MWKYCEKCEKWVYAKNDKRVLVFDIFGEIVKTENDILVCSECGEEFLEICPEILMRIYDEKKKEDYTG